MVINKFPNREVYEKIKEKGSLGADDVNVLEDYPGLEWKGEYSSTATYVKGDIVYYENMLYVMVSASVIGAIPGIDNDWIDFAKRSVTSSDVTTALGFTPADSTKVLPLSGGTLTGNLTGKYITGTWLQTTDAGHLATTPTKIPVFDDKGWIYYRTPAEILKDIGASSGYTLTEADKSEIAGKVTADGLEFTLADLPAGGSSGSGESLSLGMTSAAVGQIAKISAVDENGVPTAWEPVDMPSGRGSNWVKVYDGSSTIAEEVSSFEVNLSKSDPMKEFQLWLKLDKNTAADWGANKNISVKVNGADIGYFIFQNRLDAYVELFVERSLEAMTVSKRLLTSVKLDYNNVTPYWMVGQGSKQTNDGKLSISFPAPYAGKITAIVFGRY